MKLVPPVSEEVLFEVEKELIFQKKRLNDAVSRSTAKIQKNISLVNWIRSHPLQSGTLLFIGGFILMRKLKSE